MPMPAVPWLPIATAGAAMLLGACQSTVREVPPAPLVARPVIEIERFEIQKGGAVLGTLRHFEIRDPQQPLRFYRVENRRGAWLGHATEQGRFSRRVPFADREHDLGVHSLPRGIAELFEVEGVVELRALPVAVPAALDRGASDLRR